MSDETKVKTAEEWFAEMWGSAHFDCGPEDYQFMAEQSIAATEAMDKVGRYFQIWYTPKAMRQQGAKQTTQVEHDRFLNNYTGGNSQPAPPVGARPVYRGRNGVDWDAELKHIKELERRRDAK